ncbi:MAG TPA: 30S ribosomal protein S12 methylthiotransferase RimO [Longimicrobiales bacterium]|nr:30S ribosomal protein S12 methylthiotransferase RimO [Longimicrobiales bacterium]
MHRTGERRTQLPVLAARAPDAVIAPHAAPAADAPRIGVLTLGCDKNTVDSERLLARLAGAGAHVTNDIGAADVVVINTCGFIDVAKEESVDAILGALRLKQAGRVRAVVAIGCMVQRYKPELQRELPEVDLFLGLTEAERLVPELRARGLLDNTVTVSTMEQPLRLLSTATRHTSYLKISEGCDHTCAFCAIPLMRGKHRSTPIDVLVREAQDLEQSGVVELNLISQDTTWYGRDSLRGATDASGDWFIGRTFSAMPNVDRALLTGRDAGATVAERVSRAASGDRRQGLLPELLQALLDHTSIPWLRLFYMYPSGIYRELVELIASEPRIVPYIDMPIQHGSDSVLKRMRRPERQATIRERVTWLRAAIPGVALRTTVIVGFPGESDDEFDDMVELLEEIRFDHLGAFSYSIEEDTHAAAMQDHVDDGVKRERLEQLLDVQRTISQERNEQWLGRDVTVLIDALTGRAMDDPSAPVVEAGAIARTARQALEIDGVVHIENARGSRPGEFVRARITHVLEDDMKAEIRDRTVD